jgi:hypothetical protein
MFLSSVKKVPYCVEPGIALSKVTSFGLVGEGSVSAMDRDMSSPQYADQHLGLTNLLSHE